MRVRITAGSLTKWAQCFRVGLGLAKVKNWVLLLGLGRWCKYPSPWARHITRKAGLGKEQQDSDQHSGIESVGLTCIAMMLVSDISFVIWIPLQLIQAWDKIYFRQMLKVYHSVSGFCRGKIPWKCIISQVKGNFWPFL